VAQTTTQGSRHPVRIALDLSVDSPCDVGFLVGPSARASTCRPRPSEVHRDLAIRHLDLVPAPFGHIGWPC
jgi:hypothetical protein